MIRLFTNQPELYNDWRWVWSGPWSTWSLVTLACCLLVALWFGWRTSHRLATRWQRVTLLVLRLLAAGLFWLLLLGPAVELRHVQKTQNFLPIFLDVSASMRAQEKKKGPTRLDRMKAFYKRNKGLFDRMAREQKVRTYTFARKVRPLSVPPKQLQANGDQTNLLGIGQTLREKYLERPLAGVVLMTDGIDTLALGEQTSGTATRKTSTKQRQQRTSRRMGHFVQMLKKLNVPVHIVAPAPGGRLRDIATTDVYGDSFAFLHNTATIEARISVHGYGAMQLPVSLYREGELLRSKMLRVEAGKHNYSVSFKFKPHKAGKFIYSVRVPVMAGEAVVENNNKFFILKIIRDRIRVLQVVGRPSWDVRFLRRLLKKNANIDLISFFIMRTHHNIQPVPLNEIALIPFPSRKLFTEALPTFDLVIFQNFNYGPYLRRSYLNNIVRFVRKGGAFVMVGGELSFGAGGYLGTWLEQTLPVQLGMGQVDTRWFQPGLTPAGKHHPITRLFPSAEQTAKLWKKLPQVAGTNLVGEPRPGSVVLLQHPFLKTDGGRPLPVLTVGEHGKGRVMALSIDESWRWNLGHIGNSGTRAPYYRFWNNAIRWLIRDPELEQVQVTTFRSSYRHGESARFRIKVLNRKYQPKKQGNVKIEILRVPGNKSLHKGSHKIQSDGTVSLSWKPPKSGMYRIRVTSKNGKKSTSQGAELFQVRGLHDEFQRITPNIPLLASIARKTGGRLHHFKDSVSSLPLKPATVVRVDRSRTLDLWDNIPALALLLLLCAVEWTLRRRWGLP